MGAIILTDAVEPETPKTTAAVKPPRRRRLAAILAGAAIALFGIGAAIAGYRQAKRTTADVPDLEVDPADELELQLPRLAEDVEATPVSVTAAEDAGPAEAVSANAELASETLATSTHTEN